MKGIENNEKEENDNSLNEIVGNKNKRKIKNTIKINSLKI